MRRKMFSLWLKKTLNFLLFIYFSNEVMSPSFAWASQFTEEDQKSSSLLQNVSKNFKNDKNDVMNDNKFGIEKKPKNLNDNLEFLSKLSFFEHKTPELTKMNHQNILTPKQQVAKAQKTHEESHEQFENQEKKLQSFFKNSQNNFKGFHKHKRDDVDKLQPPLVSNYASGINARVVTTQYGVYRGIVITLPNLPKVEAFLGIPYASLMNGELRFMPPTSFLDKWDNVKIACNFQPVCPQNKYENLLNKNKYGAFTDEKNKKNDINNLYKPHDLKSNESSTNKPKNENSTPFSMKSFFYFMIQRILPFIQDQTEECLSLNIYMPLKST